MRPGALLATDLDRTLIPNGSAPESPGARRILAEFVRRAELTLVYVTGRRLELVEAAMAEYELPPPDLVSTDVGSGLYTRAEGGWRRSASWDAWLAEEWPEAQPLELAAGLDGVVGLRSQEPEAQGDYKLSYFAELALGEAEVRRRVEPVLEALGLPTALVYSVDEAAGVGLVDVLPARSTKRRALEFLLRERGLSHEQVLFAGDSGNDREVLLSPIPGVLVANADDTLRADLLRQARELSVARSLYLARGEGLGLNGNYAAGILEGWLHFHPEDSALLAELTREP